LTTCPQPQTIDLSGLEVLVIDEADRMFDMFGQGFPSFRAMEISASSSRMLKRARPNLDLGIQ
jgi:hypothetical protein